ncbi:hypothetical protein FGB62_30g26 [Gracilaria domingensis]|nr:hypothetical protein FGB62_30g26 [Gracilaria domingensis]
MTSKQSSAFRKILLSSIVILIAARSTTSQTSEAPPPDPEPDLQDGHTIFALSMSFISVKLGFSIAVINAIKLLLSENVGLPLKSWVYTQGLVIDSSKSLFLITLNVLVSSEGATEKEALAIDFITSGKLDEEFANLGLPDMSFTITSPDATDNDVSLPQTPQSDLEELIDAWPLAAEGEEFSRLFDLYVQSPSIFFPPKLKEAILWFVGNETDTLTEPPSWYMPELAVLNSTRGEYIATLVHIGEENTTEAVLKNSADYVARGGLSQAILDRGARDVNITLLPNVTLVNAESEPPKAGDQVAVVSRFRMSAPISGIPKEVVAIIKSSCAVVTNTPENAWWVSEVEPEVEENANGPFKLDMGAIVSETQRIETVRLVAGLVRSRKLDHDLWASGRNDILVRLRPRMTRFKSNGSGGNAIRSTAATVAARRATLGRYAASSDRLKRLGSCGRSVGEGAYWLVAVLVTLDD